MGKNINVSSLAEMEKAAKQLIQHAQTYRQIYQKLLQHASTMGSAWEGADNQAFVQQINGFADNLKFMAEKLRKDGEYLKQQKDNYVKRQDDNIAQVKKLRN